MVDLQDAHVVEIPVSENDQQNTICTVNAIAAMENHPLKEISSSPGHLLLLKLWQREEDLYSRKIAAKESRLDSIRQENFQICCSFIIFHGIFLTILFTSSSGHTCEKWHIPFVLLVSTSLMFVFLVQVKLFRYWKVYKQLQRERNDGRAVTRCMQELRMKGRSFDLSKEPQCSKRMKSSSVEIKWRPLALCLQYSPTIFLLCFTALMVPASKFILCGA